MMRQRPIFINGRFWSQHLTGVQRFAQEITKSIDTLIGSGDWPHATLLVPKAATVEHAYRHLAVEKVGRLGGQAWEQIELPFHLRGGFLLNLGNTAPLRVGSRQAVVIHDMGIVDTPNSYSAQYRIWSKAMLRILVGRRAQILTVSNFSRRRISTLVHVPAQKIGIVREGAEHISRFEPDVGILARNDLIPGRYALIVGTQAAHKNLPALGQVARVLDQHQMKLAITGSLNGAVFAAADQTISHDFVRLGRVSDGELRALYQNASCLIFPSHYEGFGLPPIEAMACGCPVVAQAGGAVEEICADTAAYFDSAGHTDLASVVETLVADPARADKLRQAGNATVTHYNWLDAARDLRELIAAPPGLPLSG